MVVKPIRRKSIVVYIIRKKLKINFFINKEMEAVYNLCNSCYFSFKDKGYKINNEYFCSKKCLPRCFLCGEKKEDVIYCKTNSCYFCYPCSLKRCKYCNLYSEVIKCKCD